MYFLCPKGVKDKVKQSSPKRRQLEVGNQAAPRILVFTICQLCFSKIRFSYISYSFFYISYSLSCFKSFAKMPMHHTFNYANIFKTQFCILNKWIKTLTRYWGFFEDNGKSYGNDIINVQRHKVSHFWWQVLLQAHAIEIITLRLEICSILFGIKYLI